MSQYHPGDHVRVGLYASKLESGLRMSADERAATAALLRRLAAGERVAAKFVGVVHSLALAAALADVDGTGGHR